MQNNHTEYTQRQTGAAPSYAVIWLHGLGADGDDFSGIVPQLSLSSSPAIRFIFPHAPLRAITANGGMVMRGWYDIKHIPIDLSDEEDQSSTDEQGAQESAAIVRQLIEQENKRGINTENIFIAGFSQGGAIALYAALRYPQKLAGVIALSTYLLDIKTTAQAKTSINQDMPIFFAHGRQDPIIPLSVADNGQRQLRQRGYSVAWHVYDMPHALHPQEVMHISQFLSDNIR